MMNEPIGPVLVTPKPWWKSRTIWTGILSVLAGAGTLAIPGPAGSTVAVASGVAGIVLRTITAAPIAGTEKAKSEG